MKLQEAQSVAEELTTKTNNKKNAMKNLGLNPSNVLISGKKPKELAQEKSKKQSRTHSFRKMPQRGKSGEG